MRSEQLDVALEAFQQLEDTGNRRFDGLGLGLTLCRKVVDAIGGILSVKSAAGEGTTVIAWLPVGLESTPNSQHAELVRIYSNRTQSVQSTSSSNRELHALVAEDVPHNQEVVRRMIEDFGHTAECVDNGLQMVEAVSRAMELRDSSRRFDFIIADLRMPGCDGLEAIRRIRDMERVAGFSKDARIPIIVLTASGETINEHQVMEAGADGFLVKPVNPEQLRNTIGRLLQHTPAVAESTDDDDAIIASFLKNSRRRTKQI